MARGFVAWEDEHRVAIVTFQSNNAKTGNMAQVWILVKAESPFGATMTGADALVCGDCKHRKQRVGGMGTCYVNVARAPAMVWDSWKRGLYPEASPKLLAKLHGRRVRLGAYGDPAFVPFEVWERLLRGTLGHTGYTHAWRWADQRLQTIVMASVDTPDERLSAEALGWRTFRVRGEAEERAKDERQCPAAEESGHALQCEDCMACGGTSTARRSVSIAVHGQGSKRFLPLYAA